MRTISYILLECGATAKQDNVYSDGSDASDASDSSDGSDGIHAIPYQKCSVYFVFCHHFSTKLVERNGN